MAYGKIAAINYETPEQAATMAAQINATEQENSIRAYNNGRTLEIIPSNPLVADLLAFFANIAKSIVGIAKTSADSARDNSKGSVSA